MHGNSLKRSEVRSRAVDDIDAATDPYASASEQLVDRRLTTLRGTATRIGRRPTFGSPAFAQLSTFLAFATVVCPRFPTSSSP